MFDFIRGRLLGVPDMVNRKMHPFYEFTRPAYIIDPRPISEKADLAWEEMERWRFGPQKEFYANAWPTDGGDHAFFQGQHTAAAILRKDHVVTARSMFGQAKLQYLGGDSRMSRGADSNKPGNNALEVSVPEGRMTIGDPNRKYYLTKDYVYHQNCSESSLIGQNIGNFFALMLGSGEIETSAKKSSVNLADQLIADGYRMLDQDGTPAEFGDLRDGFKSAPIRIGTLSCTLILAYKASGATKYKVLYEDLVRRNMGALTHQETHFLWIHPYYQDLLAYYNYMILSVLDRTGRRGRFLGALRRLWERTNQEGNSLYAYIARFSGVNVTREYLNQAKKTLSEFNLDQEAGPTGKGKGSTGYGEPYPDWIVTAKPWGWKWMRGGKKNMSRQPLPMAFRPSMDFAWQRDPYTISGYSDHEYNMLDLVLAEALGRHIGAL